MKRLNEQQRRLVEENHNLIYSFLIKNKLPHDEYYDILAIGLCKAALRYEPQKGAFSTFVYSVMQCEVFHKIRDERRKKDIPEALVVSFDAVFDTDRAGDVNLLDVVESDINVEAQCLSKIAVESFFRSLDNVSLTILSMRMQGSLQQEIGNRINLSQMQISRKLSKMKEQCKEMLYA